MGRVETELASVLWLNTGSISLGYAGSVPLEGAWWIREVVITVPAVNSKVLPHYINFAARSEVATSPAEQVAGEPLFPMLTKRGTVGHVLHIVASEVVFRVTGRFLMRFNGRRIVGMWYNGNAASADAEALFVMERAGERKV